MGIETLDFGSRNLCSLHGTRILTILFEIIA
jgi:hypothetical protein